MLNEVLRVGDSLSVPVTAGTRSGTPLRIGILNAVAITDEASVTDPNFVYNGIPLNTGGIGNLNGWTSAKLDGSYRLEVTGAVAAVGAPVYIKTDGTLTTVAAGAFLFGASLQIKNATKAINHVRLVQPGQVTANA